MGRAKSTKLAGKRPRSARRPSRPRPRRDRSANAVEVALAALAHEVRTPLTGILALSELLAASDLPDRERRWAAAVKSAAEHLAQLTTLVVDGAKGSKRTLRLARERFRPRGLADAMAAALVARAEAKGLATDIDIDDDLPDLVVGDPVRLRAAIENLIDNAVKFTERGRVGLAVAMEPAGRHRPRLVFTVTDSGIGLSRAESKRLFRPFAQASDLVAHEFGGSGLGLVFIKRVAKAMGGDVAVTSEPGRGSTFRLTVAVERSVADTQRKAKDKSARGVHAARRAGGLRILCAEDNPYGRVILNTILIELGHRVDFAATGTAAVEALSRGGYDLALMDVTLPGVDGIEATRRIRALHGSAARIPIIGISGRAAASEEAEAREAGMDAYLTKPVSPSMLAEIIRTTTSR